jgi:DNA recombination-mediator protein A.
MATSEPTGVGAATIPTFDELAQELLLIQQSGPRKVAIIGTRNLPLTHQQLVEMLSYALVLSGNHVLTSGGANGTNMAVIRGAQRANPDRVTVILPQTIGQQPAEVQDLLIGIKNITEFPERRTMTLADASRICNQEIMDKSQQIICFLYHTSHTLLSSVNYAKERRKIVTSFYLD